MPPIGYFTGLSQIFHSSTKSYFVTWETCEHLKSNLPIVTSAATDDQMSSSFISSISVPGLSTFNINCNLKKNKNYFYTQYLKQ